MAGQAPRNGTFIYLPTPVLIGQPSSMFGELMMKTSVRSTVSTAESTFSQASDRVREMVSAEFGMLYVGTNFLERLIAYVDTGYSVPAPAAQTPPYRATDAPPEQHVDDHPSTEQIVNGIVGMYLAEMMIRQGTPPPVSTDAGVQDAAGGQIFPVLNSVIRTKEVNTIDEEHLPEGPGVITKDNAKSRKAKDAQARTHFAFLDSNEPAELEDIRKLYFCPLWTRSPPGLLQTHGTAGNADFVLLKFPSNISDAVVANCEIRQPWEYTTRDIWRIYESHTLFIMPEEPHGFYNDPRYKDGPVNELLKMVFGQVKSLETSIGFFTNMDIIVFYAYYDGFRDMTDKEQKAQRAATMTTRAKAGDKPGHGVARSGLVLSWPIPFTHPMALRCLQGLSYLALDEKRWGTRNLQIVDIVAPGHELRQIKPQLVIPRRGHGLIAPDPDRDVAAEGEHGRAEHRDGHHDVPGVHRQAGLPEADWDGM